MSDKTEKVKEYFERSEVYLGTEYNKRIRFEVVQEYVKGLNYSSILDIGCGNASASIALLNNNNNLTLIDISSDMLEQANKQIPESARDRVKSINEDFMKIDIAPSSYDLIICLGVLAHVESVEQTVSKIANSLKPGGHLIIQNSNSSHFFGYLIRITLSLRELLKQNKYAYKFNMIGKNYLKGIMLKNKLKLKKEYSYIQSFLGFSRFFKDETKFNLIKSIFGSAGSNKRKYLGSEEIYLYRKD